MGSVSAKELPKETMVRVPHSEAPVPNLSKPVRVDRIFIKGLSRTEDDFIRPIVNELFLATNFGEVLVKADKVQRRLEDLECFKNIEILVDESKGAKSTTNGLEVTFHVIEMKRILGNASISSGNHEASFNAGCRFPNILGRAEKIQVEYNYGNKYTSNVSVTASKPLINPINTLFRASVNQQHSTWPPSGYKDLDRGVILGFEFDSAPKIHHQVQWEGVWRELSVLKRQVPMVIRGESGHTLKSAFTHSFTVDKRNRNIFPTKGTFFELKTELAGIGGDVGFLKNEVKLEKNVSLFKDFVLQGTLHAGMLNELFEDKKVSICDLFFLGGPTSIRGFEMRGAGPHVEGLAVGSEVYWAGGVNLYAPLPFRVFDKSFGDLFRTHLFINAGNIGKFDSGNDYKEFFRQMVSGMRVACGCGLAIRLGSSARLELNYCVPLSSEAGDRPYKGFQFGVGINFL